MFFFGRTHVCIFLGYTLRTGVAGYTARYSAVVDNAKEFSRVEVPIYTPIIRVQNPTGSTSLSALMMSFLFVILTLAL